MKILILATACFMPLVLMAQIQAPHPPRLQTRPQVDALSQQSGEGLRDNITIRLLGTTTTGSDIDLTLTGIGPKFTADQVVNDDTLLTCQYVVSETETGYKVSYFVSARILVTKQSDPNPPRSEYRDVSISGTVLCLADKPMSLVSNEQKSLQLTISKEAE